MRLSGRVRINPQSARKRQASITIEAAIALPIFLFLLLSIAFLILALRTQEVVQCCLINAADTMATQYYPQADPNNPLIITSANGESLFKDYLIDEFYKRIDDAYDENNPPSMSDRTAAVDKTLKNNYFIEDGFEGIEFSGSNASVTWDSNFDPGNNENNITITVRYEIKIPFPTQAGNIPIFQRVRVRVWGTGD